MVTATDVVVRAAALLDDLGSGTLSHGDLYINMFDAGGVAAQLCSLVLTYEANLAPDEKIVVVRAAECLKDICIASDNFRWQRAIRSAQGHANDLRNLEIFRV